MARKKTFKVDLTSTRMNEIAQKLRETRTQACDEISALGWPTDIYGDPEWYQEITPLNSLSYKRRESYDAAKLIRQSILEIDFTLAAMNHYSETYADAEPNDEVNAVIEALDSAINAITSFFTPNAEIGKQQRFHARKSRKNLAQHQMHKRWASEDRQLHIKNPNLSKSDRARQIARNQNMSSKSDEKIISWEAVRSAIRRMGK